MMTSIAVVLGKFGPGLVFLPSTRGKQIQSCPCRSYLPDCPGARLEIEIALFFRGLIPMLRHDGQVSCEFEVQWRVACGVEIMVDLLAGRADVALRAHLRSIEQVFRRQHAVGFI